MFKKIVGFTFFVFALGLLTSASHAQLLGLYEFDGGGDGTSWDDATNWEQVLDPDGNPISGDPATPPGPTTSADIAQLGVVLVDSGQPGQTALDVNIGTADGAGSVTITGGGLDASDDIHVGAGAVGLMFISGGSNSTGDDFFINANSSLTMTGGSLDIGDRLITSDNAGLVVDAGDVFADDDFFFFGSPQITVNGGSMIVLDKMRFDDDESQNGQLTINGGFVRSEEFHYNITDITDFRGVVEINGDGVYQVKQGDGSTLSELTVAMAEALIAEGVHFTTSEESPLELGVQTVIIPEFKGEQNVPFTQISVIPEPASVLLLGFAGLGLLWKRRTR